MLGNNKNKIILALLLAVLAVNISYAGEFGILSHHSDVSLSTEWIAPNSEVNVSFIFENNITSTGNITKVTLDTSTNPLRLNITDVFCPLDWTNKTIKNAQNVSDMLIDSIECRDTGASKFTPNTSAFLNITINVLSIPQGTTNVTNFNWLTLDDDPATANQKIGNLYLWIDAKGPAINIIATPSVGTAIGNGNVIFNVTIAEGEVQVDNSTDSLSAHVSTSGICGALSSPSLVCDASQKNCNYSFIMDASSGDGECNVTVSFNDTFNNTGATTGNYDVDNTGPVMTLTSGDEIKSGDLITFNIIDIPAGVDTAWWLNGSSNETMPNTSAVYSINTTGWAEGNVTIKAWANDTLGNLGDRITSGASEYEEIIFFIDDTAPDVTINSPSAGTFGSTIFVNVTAEDDNTVESVTAIINGTATGLTRTAGTDFWTGNIPSPADEGTYSLTINASDRAGNYNDSESVSGIEIDRTAPAVTVTSPELGTIYTSNPVTVSATTDENASWCRYSLDSGANVSMSEITGTSWTLSSSMSNGEHSLTVYCSDSAGNVGASVLVSFKVSVSGGGGGGSSGTLGFIPAPKIEKENTKPEITEPKIDNEAPKQGETIRCIPGDFFDADGETKAGDNFIWLVNGEEVQSGVEDYFDTGNTETGSEIQCMNRATDGMDYSEWMLSSNSAVVQEPDKTEPLAAEQTAEKRKATNPFTGAFIGGLLEDNVAVTVLLVTIFGGALAVFTVRFIKRRNLKFKLD